MSRLHSDIASTVLTFFFSLYQQTPLHFAVKKGNKYVVEYLVDNHADIDVINENGVSI